MTKLLEAQYELLIKKIDIMQETMDRRFAEWSEDRKLITDLEVRLKILEAHLEGMRDDIADGSRKMLKKVDTSLDPVPGLIEEAVNKSVSEIKKKKWIDKIVGK